MMADNKALRNRESRTPSRGRSGGRTDTLASERQGLTGGFMDVPAAQAECRFLVSPLSWFVKLVARPRNPQKILSLKGVTRLDECVKRKTQLGIS